MRVRRAELIAGARAATGIAVIIDVFRAFTTAAFCVAAGAREIVLVATPAEALAHRERDPGAFLTGEVDGRPIPGFDAGNSPSIIETLRLDGRRVVQRSSSGTQGVVAAAGASAVLLGSLVIASATARYLARATDEITLVAMGDGGTEPNDEDAAGADYLEALLLGRPVDARALVARLWVNEHPWPDWFPRRDAELACEVDRFDFALPVRREGGDLVARPVRL